MLTYICSIFYAKHTLGYRLLYYCQRILPETNNIYLLFTGWVGNRIVNILVYVLRVLLEDSTRGFTNDLRPFRTSGALSLCSSNDTVQIRSDDPYRKPDLFYPCVKMVDLRH